jgi:hypothetical protein
MERLVLEKGGLSFWERGRSPFLRLHTPSAIALRGFLLELHHEIKAERIGDFLQ